MSLSNETNKISYSPATPETEFNFPYPYFNSTDIFVTIQDSEGVITELAYPTEYSVAATNGDVEIGALVTTVASYTSGDTVVISRVVPYTQEFDQKTGASLDATALNKVLDRVVAQNQQQNELLERQVSFPITDPSGLDYELPSVDNRSNRVQGFDTDGNVIAVDLAATGAVGVDTSKGLEINSSVISAKTDGVTTDFSGSGDIIVKDSGISTAKLEDGAITAVKLGSDIHGQHMYQGSTNDLNVFSASETQVGCIEIATEAEALAGTATMLAMTPATTKAVTDALPTPTFSDYVEIRETQLTTVNGTTLGAAADTKINLNDIAKTQTWLNPLGSSVYRIPAGSYYFDAIIPVFGANDHGWRAIIHDAAGVGTDVVEGMSRKVGSDDDMLICFVSGEYTFVASADIQLNCFSGGVSFAGAALSDGRDEVYSNLKIYKIS